MGFAHVQKVKKRLVVCEIHFLKHGAHIVMPVHEFVAIEAAIQDSHGIQHGQRDHGVRAIAEALQKNREI